MQSSNIPSSSEKRPRIQAAGIETIDMESTLSRLQMPTKQCNRFREIFHSALPAIRTSKSAVKRHVLEQVFAYISLILSGSDSEHMIIMPYGTCSAEPALQFTVMYAFVLQLLQYHGTYLITQLCSEMQTNDAFEMEFDEYVACIKHAMKGVEHVNEALELLQRSMLTFKYSDASEQIQCDYNTICTLQQRLESAQCRMLQKDCSVLFATRFLQYHDKNDAGEPCLTRSALILAGSRPVTSCTKSYTQEEQCDLAKRFIVQLVRFDCSLSDKLQDAIRQQPNLYDLYQCVKNIVNTSASSEDIRFRALQALKDVTTVLIAAPLPPQQQAPVITKSLTLDDVLDKIGKLQLVCRRERCPLPKKRPHTTYQKQQQPRWKEPKM